MKKNNDMEEIKINSYKLNKKIRKNWNINPVEKIKKSKRKYNRKKIKQEFRKKLNEERL